MLEALRLLRPSPRVLSMTGSHPQDAGEELRVSNPSPFPAKLAPTSKLEKQLHSAPLTPGPAQKHLRFLRHWNRRGCLSRQTPVPRARRSKPSSKSAVCAPPCEAPRDMRHPESLGRVLVVQVGDPWSYSRAAGWDGKWGLTPSLSLQKQCSWHTDASPPQKASGDSADPSGTVSSCAE